MELFSSMERPMARTELEITGTSVRLGRSHRTLLGTSLRFIRLPQRRAYVIMSKYQGNRRRPAAGKSVEEKQKEFAVRREELLRKSRGELSFAGIGKQKGDNIDTLETFQLANEYGALSVSALQPMEEKDYSVGNVFGRERIRLSSLSRQIMDNSVVTQRAAQQEFKGRTANLSKEETVAPQVHKIGVAGVVIEHIVSRKVKHEVVEENTVVSPNIERKRRIQKVEQDQEASSSSVDSSSEEDDEEWVEVGLDDVEEEEYEEKVEYWEGDLPPMTPEEEEEVLREAELELAELERRKLAGIDSDVEDFPSKVGADSETVKKERKLAELKSLVQQMEKELAGSDGVTGSSRGSNSEVHGRVVRNSLHISDEQIEGKELSDEEVDEDHEFGVPDREQQITNSDKIRPESMKTVPNNKHQRTEDYWASESDEEEIVEERGIPAVMRCFDRAKIYLKAGDGGNGVVAFRREKYVPFGGPSGGTGGRGGHVYIEADTSMNSLLPFRKNVHFRAGRGSHGGGKRKEGAGGSDCTVKVPPGTLIKECGPEGKVLVEMNRPGQLEMLLPGGAGGRGNAAFKTGRNNAPQMAELGEEGAEMWVELELKLVADVGIVGVPNAGKSTLLSAISAAKPEIANYPFTTLLPNLGVVALDYDATMVVADLPGLLEGAHTGLGLGHEFLRHTERCSVLIHVVDGMSQQPEEELEAVRLELQLFNPALSEKPFVVAFNKMDILEAAERWDTFQEKLRAKGLEPFCMSAATQQGTSEVISAAYELLKNQKKFHVEEYFNEEEKAIAVAEMVSKQRSAPIENFTINADMHTRTWQVIGAGLERFTQMTNWEYFESMRRFQHVLSASGVNKALKERGIREGDTVIVGEMEFNWLDSEDMADLTNWKRGVRGSKVWPH